jgi:hypothetical protein
MDVLTDFTHCDRFAQVNTKFRAELNLSLLHDHIRPFITQLSEEALYLLRGCLKEVLISYLGENSSIADTTKLSEMLIQEQLEDCDWFKKFPKNVLVKHAMRFYEEIEKQIGK